MTPEALGAAKFKWHLIACQLADKLASGVADKRLKNLAASFAVLLAVIVAATSVRVAIAAHTVSPRTGPSDLFDLVRELGSQTRIMNWNYSGRDQEEGSLRKVLQHPACCFETDTILTGNGVDNGALTPYQKVYADFYQFAQTSLDRNYVPLSVKDYVRDYFSSLDPKK